MFVVVPRHNLPKEGRKRQNDDDDGEQEDDKALGIQSEKAPSIDIFGLQHLQCSCSG